MPKFADILISLGIIDVAIGVVRKYFWSRLKKNPTSVSTGGVLGRANNWRSLDSRTYSPANAVPK